MKMMTNAPLPPYRILEKKVGETPLSCVESWKQKNPKYKDTKTAYAGRLDPMASGKLLVLLGDECKRQDEYHELDKEYEFSVLFGVTSDTGDVLGIVSPCNEIIHPKNQELISIARSLKGSFIAPYPAYSSKTVRGKPLHTWAVEGRLGEIDIPTFSTTIYKLTLIGTERVDRDTVVDTALSKIDTIPPVTDPKKERGRDFRRVDVRASWEHIRNLKYVDSFTVASFRCTAASGAYMRTLGEEIAKRAGTSGLAYSINRTKIGRYHSLPILSFGFWSKQF